MTQTDLAGELGVGKPYISLMRSGKEKPSKGAAEKLKEVDLSVSCGSIHMASNSLRGINNVFGGFDPHPIPLVYVLPDPNTRSSPTRRVTFSWSRCSSRAWAYLRLVLNRSRVSARVILPLALM